MRRGAGGGERRRAAGPCVTRRLPLVGAAGRSGVVAPERLVRKYGGEAAQVVAEAAHDPDLLAPIAEGIETTRAELRFAVCHEGALDVGDLLDRRTRIGLVAMDRERATPAAKDALADADR